MKNLLRLKNPSSRHWGFILKLWTWQQRIWGHQPIVNSMWRPGLRRYQACASICTDHQSQRLGIRYRPEVSTPAKKGKSSSGPTPFVHMLNATACAVPRMIICLLENC